MPIPGSYTQPHADLLYKSSDVALRAPSAVLARRKLRDLKLHRKHLSQINGHSQVNGIRKTSRTSKQKEKSREKELQDDASDERRKSSLTETTSKDKTQENSIAQSIEPLSPMTTQAIPAGSQHTATSATADNASTNTGSDQNSNSNPNLPPSTLNQSDPEATIIGRQPSASAAMAIRKHFNAQPLNEVETIARFTYVVRQQGSSVLSHHHGRGGQAGPSSTQAAGGSSAVNALNSKGSNLGNGHVRVEGSDGDSQGWIMGSMGREVRMKDSGGVGTFRLRFRP